jgi:hypothetical protein
VSGFFQTAKVTQNMNSETITIEALLNFEWVDLWTIDDLLVVDAPVAERSLVGR